MCNMKYALFRIEGRGAFTELRTYSPEGVFWPLCQNFDQVMPVSIEDARGIVKEATKNRYAEIWAVPLERLAGLSPWKLIQWQSKTVSASHFDRTWGRHDSSSKIEIPFLDTIEGAIKDWK